MFSVRTYGYKYIKKIAINKRPELFSLFITLLCKASTKKWLTVLNLVLVGDGPMVVGHVSQGAFILP